MEQIKVNATREQKPAVAPGRHQLKGEADLRDVPNAPLRGQPLRGLQAMHLGHLAESTGATWAAANQRSADYR